MSGTTSTATVVTPSGATVTVYIPSNPGVYDYSQLYFANGTTNGTYVPAVNSLVWENNVPYKVSAVDTSTLTFTLEPAYLSNATDGFGLASIVSYGNDIFRGYYDTRSVPYRFTPDSRITLSGGSPSTYQITRYPNTPQATIISQYYSTTGVLQGQSIPLTQVGPNLNEWFLTPGTIDTLLTDDESLLVTVFNEIGAEIASVTLLAKQSIIVNNALAYRPEIASITMTANQLLPNGDVFAYEQQSLDSLNIQAILTYVDGTTRTLVVDNTQCFLFGQTDFVASFTGLKQVMLLKYYLSLDENAVTPDPSGSSVSVQFNVVVVPGTISTPMKISVIPEYNNNTGLYNLKYYYYNTTGTVAIDVTALVSITSGTYVGNDYVDNQSFTFSLDMSKVDPVTYTVPTTYSQNVAIKLQPQSAYVRYIISDSLTSAYVYGQDSSASRRPILYYDSSKQLYFVPSSIFANQTAFLNSFYYNANPPYDPSTLSGPPTPTHFSIRDAFTGNMIVAAIMPISTYVNGFSLINGANGAYMNSTVIVEFIQQINGTQNLIIFGVPVDIVAGTYTG